MVTIVNFVLVEVVVITGASNLVVKLCPASCVKVPVPSSKGSYSGKVDQAFGGEIHRRTG